MLTEYASHADRRARGSLLHLDSEPAASAVLGSSSLLI